AVVEGGARVRGGDIGRTRRLVRVEDVAAIAELGGGDAKHSAELAAAEDADGRPRRDRHSGASATEPVCFWRQASSRAASASSTVASMAAASSAALTAPALPMARVPTGIPAGIWTIDKRLSMPFRAWVSIGTPSTGSAVIDAVMPGKWAAPPAPAITILSPRSFAEWAYS